jgi:hypothetical protein
MSHVNTRQRNRLFLICEPEQFRAGAIAESVIFSCRVDEYRSCPLCAAPASTLCTCSFTTQRPSHPYDFAHIFSNYVEQHLGQYVGDAKTTIVVPDNDGPQILQSSDAHGGGRISNDDGGNVEVLTAQFLCLQLPAPSPPEPSQLCARRKYLQAPNLSKIDLSAFAQESPQSDVHHRISSVLQSFVLSVHASSSVPSPFAIMSLPPPLAPIPGDAVADTLDRQPPATYVFGAARTTEASVPTCFDDGLTPSVSEDRALFRVDAPIPSFHYATGDPDFEGCMAGNDTEHHKNNIISSSAVCAKNVNEWISSPSPSTLVTGVLPLAQPTFADASKHKDIVKLPLIVNIRPSNCHVTKRLMDASAVKYREAERKEKNRIAASRSNARRKAINDGLKKAVQDRRATIAQLRERQEALHRENNYLRQCAERNSPS